MDLILQACKSNLALLLSYENTGFVIDFPEFSLTVSMGSGTPTISGSFEPETFGYDVARMIASKVKNGRGESPLVTPFEEWKKRMVEDTERVISQFSTNAY